MRSDRKKHAAEQAVGKGVTGGEYIYVQMPGEALEIKLYAPYKSRPESERERITREELRKEIRRAVRDYTR